MTEGKYTSDLYARLGISRGTFKELVEIVYDMKSGLLSALPLTDSIERELKALKFACAVLSNPERRARYDAAHPDASRQDLGWTPALDFDPIPHEIDLNFDPILPEIEGLDRPIPLRDLATGEMREYRDGVFVIDLSTYFPQPSESVAQQPVVPAEPETHTATGRNIEYVVLSDDKDKDDK